MNKNFTLIPALVSVLAAMGLASCSSVADEPAHPDAPAHGTARQRYIIAAAVKDSRGTSNVLMSAPSLTEGQISAVGNGLVNDGASQWVFFDNTHLYALSYNQGSASTTRSYTLGSSGLVRARDLEYKISRYSAYGIAGGHIMTTSSGDGPRSQADAHGYLPRTLLFTSMDVENETAVPNNTADGTYSLENYVGNGEYVTLAGLETAGGRIFSGLYPMGLSQYGAAQDGGKWVRPGYEDLVAKANGGSASSAYKKGELPGSQYPDECWVAMYKDATLTTPKLLHTSRISAPAGRFKSQYYQTVRADDNGNVYVFSPSYSKTMTDARQRTKLPAGVMRIAAGTEEFDNNFYFNIEAASGGRSFMRVWHAGGSRFLLQMYDRPLTQKGFAATQLAIFDADRLTLTPVSGLPEDLTSIGANALAENVKVFISINSANSYPAIYVIDTQSAQAVRGLTVAATEITGLGILRAS